MPQGGLIQTRLVLSRISLDLVSLDGSKACHPMYNCGWYNNDMITRQTLKCLLFSTYLALGPMPNLQLRKVDIPTRVMAKVGFQLEGFVKWRPVWVVKSDTTYAFC